MLPDLSLWYAFSFSHKGTFLRWIRRCTANRRLTWPHSRLTGLRSQELYARGKSPCNRLSLRFPAPEPEKHMAMRVDAGHDPEEGRTCLFCPRTSFLSLGTSISVVRALCPASSYAGNGSTDIRQKSFWTSCEGRRHGH